MNPVTRVRDYFRDNVGHMTRPGSASFDAVPRSWYVTIRCRTANGEFVLGDVDAEGRIVYAPGREELASRMGHSLSILNPIRFE